jgi:hypothetical protein
MGLAAPYPAGQNSAGPAAFGSDRRRNRSGPTTPPFRAGTQFPTPTARTGSSQRPRHGSSIRPTAPEWEPSPAQPERRPTGEGQAEACEWSSQRPSASAGARHPRGGSAWALQGRDGLQLPRNRFGGGSGSFRPCPQGSPREPSLQSLHRGLSPGDGARPRKRMATEPGGNPLCAVSTLWEAEQGTKGALLRRNRATFSPVLLGGASPSGRCHADASEGQAGHPDRV